MLKLFKQCKYLVFCSLYDIILTQLIRVSLFLAQPVFCKLSYQCSRCAGSNFILAVAYAEGIWGRGQTLRGTLKKFSTKIMARQHVKLCLSFLCLSELRFVFLLLREICIYSSKCEVRFAAGLCPDHWGAYSAPADPLARLKGGTRRGTGWKRRDW